MLTVVAFALGLGSIFFAEVGGELCKENAHAGARATRGIAIVLMISAIICAVSGASC